jgi:hypothetical protein
MALGSIGKGFISPAATDLGLGDSLSQQQTDETEEEKRRKKLLGLSGAAGNSPAVTQLFGLSGGVSGGAGF